MSQLTSVEVVHLLSRCRVHHQSLGVLECVLFVHRSCLKVVKQHMERCVVWDKVVDADANVYVFNVIPAAQDVHEDVVD